MPFKQNCPGLPQAIQMTERQAVRQIHLCRTRGHGLRETHDTRPVLPLRKLLDRGRVTRCALRMGRMPANGQRDEQRQCEGGAGTASSIQWPVALQSFSNAARSWESSLRSAGSFIITTPRGGSMPSTTT